MIVKNESHIIVETLKNVCAAIPFATYQISDTGSTDGTQGLIRDFFAGIGLSGELSEDAWIDFGTNRTQVLQKAYQKTDYVLMWDADDRVHGTLVFPTPMDADEYGFRFQSGTMCFRRTQLFNNRKRWKYTGVLHEYAECLEPRQPYRMIEGDYYFAANSLGARALDPEKYAKDAAVLEAACAKAEAAKDPIAARYAFYCANSYRNTTNRDKTIEFYKKVLTMSGWLQEKYMACLELWGQYELLGTPEKGVEFLMESTKYDRTRIECVYRLVKYYGCKELFEPAVACYSMIQDWYEMRFLTDDLTSRLFAKTDEYDFYLPYYMIIVAEKTKRYALGAKMYEIVWKRNYQGAGEWWMKNLLHNLQFFTDALKGRVDLVPAFDAWSATLSAPVVSATNATTLSSTKDAMLCDQGLPTQIPAKNVVQWKPTADDWVFYKGYDSCLHDIRHEPSKSLPSLMASATSQQNCVAFNTLGWLKYNVTYPLRKCLRDGHGVYIRKGYNVSSAIPAPLLTSVVTASKKRALVVQLRNYHYECLGIAVAHLHPTHPEGIDVFFPSAPDSEWISCVQQQYPALRSLRKLPMNVAYDTVFFLTSHDQEEFGTFATSNALRVSSFEGFTHIPSMEIENPVFKQYGLSSFLPYPVLPLPWIPLTQYDNSYEPSIPLFTTGSEDTMDLPGLDILLQSLGAQMLFLTRKDVSRPYKNIIVRKGESDANLLRCFAHKRAIMWTPASSIYTQNRASGLFHSALTFRTPLLLRSSLASLASSFPRSSITLGKTAEDIRAFLDQTQTISLRFYDRDANFGDQLSPFLVESLMNRTKYRLVLNDDSSPTTLIAIGSYIQTATDGTYLYGSGIRTDPPIESGHSYTSLCVSAVRGPLTRAFLETKGVVCPPVYGDPALLLPRFYTPTRRDSLKTKIAVIPHFTQYEHYNKQMLPAAYHLISPQAPWKSVLDELCSCAAVVSSSLHGLICADAYGIPNIWLSEIQIAEGDLKFRDYFASQGRAVQSLSSLDAYDEALLYRGGNRVDLEALRRAFPFS
jgi:hypothetical protein